MTKVTSKPRSIATPNEAHYIPIKEFFDTMGAEKENTPYKSTFSFVPFIEKMKGLKRGIAKIDDQVDVAFLDEIEKKLIAFSDAKRLDTLEKRQEVVSVLFPSLFFKGQLGFVAKPFTKEFFYMTPELQEIFTSDNWEIKIYGALLQGKMGNPSVEAGKLILNTFHGQETDPNASYQTMTFRDRDTGLEKHFKIKMVLDFIKTTPLKEIKELTEMEIYDLFNEWDNEEAWLEQFPPEDYLFEGLVVGYIQDVTEVEVLSQMKEMLVSDKDEDPTDSSAARQELNNLICSFLEMPDVKFGNLLNRNFKYGKIFSWSVMGDLEDLEPFSQEDFAQSLSYGKALRTGRAVIIGDLLEIEEPSKVELHLIKKGYRSLLFSPQEDKSGRTIGIMELVSKKPYRFSNKLLNQLEEVISLFSVGTNRWIQIIDNNVSFFIQKEFTYIHPSVEWKFQEVSQKYLLTPQEEGNPPSLEPIVFKDVYPLYGQADIVGSSKIRNRSIEADMLDNLHRVQKVMKAFRKRLQFQLLDIYLAKTEAFSSRLENGGYVSSDESQIVELLTDDIHPLLRELSAQYDFLPKGILKKYFSYLDPRLDIVYRKRKSYEKSVHQLNELISTYVDAEVAKKQEVLPHFFEKYITDGVEYNIYLGQSLLQEARFSNYFLQDFRFWQLILMCEVTRLVENNKQNFPVPLSTAQLVFVYNNALSIRFNTDEKQFDVDGAYNVRYEILKKRIDKAVIKGTNERLTQKGTIAIVWLQERDRVEYLQYIEHLLQQGYITDNIEELELERLQGADGLRALRLTVAM
ncbi:MAG: GAF domain-containing protein [Bacteroidota bacterium]